MDGHDIESNGSMTMIVEFQIRKETTTIDEWLSEWSKRAEDALHGEPETSAYEAARSIEDDSNLLVFERYSRGKSSLQQHLDRPSHAALTGTMGVRRMTKRRVMSTNFFDLPNYGWWSRPERAKQMCEPDMQFLVLGTRFPESRMRDEFIELTAEHAEYCFEEEPNTLVYSGGVAVTDSGGDFDIRKGDLMFIMGCSDMAAVEKHLNDPRHVAMAEKYTEKKIAYTNTFFRHYRTTGLGFLWNEK